jgi:hypothetical protein
LAVEINSSSSVDESNRSNSLRRLEAEQEEDCQLLGRRKQREVGIGEERRRRGWMLMR